MKRNMALNEATRVACCTKQIVLAETAVARPAEGSLSKEPCGESNKLTPNQNDALNSAYEFRDTRRLISYVNNLTGNMSRNDNIKASLAARCKTRFDFSLRCLDAVPRIS